MEHDKDKFERSKRANKFVGSSFYNKDLKPYLERQIETSRNIKEIKKDEVIASYHKQLGRIEAFQSILNKIKSWDELKVIKEGGD